LVEPRPHDVGGCGKEETISVGETKIRRPCGRAPSLTKR
jgi:hypothetical protein